jgi:hypothetical protein
MSHRIFSYSQARQALETVRAKTLAASERLETLRAQAERMGPERSDQLAAVMDAVVNAWAVEIEAIGALPKGIFTVDFDSGRGFHYCWTLNEPELGHYHRYEEGFAQRRPLPEAERREPGPVLN